MNTSPELNKDNMVGEGRGKLSSQTKAGQKKKKVLFVCTGNICRSPLAHAVLQHKLEEAGLQRFYELESAGTHGYHVGENADERMRKTAQKNGVVLNHPARKLEISDLDYFDLILAMDNSHFRFLRALTNDETHKAKIRMFREFEPAGLKGGDVPDPYYGGTEEFDDVFTLVNRCSEILLNFLEEHRL